VRILNAGIVADHRESGLWYLLLVFIVLILYGFLTNNWWYGDDPEMVVFASKHSPSEYLFNPDVWQSFSPFNFVPWVVVSLQGDALFSDFVPFGYYLHQLITLVLVTLILFKVFHLFIDKALFAFFGVLIFLLTPSTLSVASWITTRQYLEGMGFSLLCIYFFVKRLRGDRLSLIFLSALFYLFAAISKEVYVPLPFLLAFLPEKTPKERLKHSIPIFCISVIYAVYRIWMLGNNPFGSYSSIWPWTFSSALLNMPEVFRLYSGLWWIFSLVLIPIIWSLQYYHGWKSTAKEAFRFISIFSFFYIPILPVSSIFGGGESLRYTFVTSTLITFLYILSIHTIWEKGYKVFKILSGMCIVVIIIGFYFTFQEEKGIWDTKRREAFVEGRFFLDNLEVCDAIFRINQPHWFFDGLEKMKGQESGKIIERRLKLVSDEFYGFERDIEGLSVFAYEKDSKSIVDITKEAKEKHEAFLKTMKERPLTVLIHVKDGTMDLQLGPYEGQYMLLEALPSQPDFYYLTFPINKRFGIKLTHRERIRIFRFAYTSSEGWTTLSPEFLIDRSKNQTVSWSRNRARLSLSAL
jgi:hypothetical protein